MPNLENITKMEIVSHRWFFDVLYVNCPSCKYYFEEEGNHYCDKGFHVFRPRKCNDFKKAGFFQRDIGYPIKIFLSLPFRIILWPFRKLSGWYGKIEKEAEEEKELER